MIHVAIIEDDEKIRELLALVIDGNEGYSCKQVYPDMETALADLPSFAYLEVVIVDIELPGMSGIEGIQVLKRKMPKTDFIMLTVRRDSESVFEALKAGASGYLAKYTSPVDLLRAIEEVKKGGAPLSPEIARKVIHSFHAEEIVSPLSEREKEILQLISNGDNYRVIAEKLFLAPTTIRTHTKNIYRKLHVNSAAQAVKKAMRDKLIE